MHLSHLLIIISALLLASPGRATPGERQPTAGQKRAVAVEESRFIPVGGIQQWLTISGSDRSNPIVVFVHGGPGNPLSPYSRSLYGRWAKDFTIVQWDQRGAGRTFEANPQTANMALTIDRMASDGIEVTEYLTRNLGQPKVLLVGGSWGSALGVHMVARRPDLFHAYVGIGQLVSESANQAASLQQLRLLAVAANDQVTLDGITALGAPPWSNPRNFGKLRRLTRTYEAKVVEPAPASWWVPESFYATPSYERAYEAGEEYSYLQFVGATGGGLLSTVDLSALGPKFQVPIYLLQGADDLVTVPTVARAWFDSISAPRKQFVLVPKAGHDPNIPLTEALYATLKAVPLER